MFILDYLILGVTVAYMNYCGILFSFIQSVSNFLIIGVMQLLISLSTVIGMGSCIEDKLVCLINVEIPLSVGVNKLERMVQSVSG